MTQILIEESRYIELLKYEAQCLKKKTVPRKHVNADLLIEAIKKGIVEYPLQGERKTYDKIIKPFFIELYGNRAGIRARQKAWKEGIAKLAEEGVIKVEPSHSGMVVITLITVVP